MDFNFDFDEKLEQLARVPRAARLGVVAVILAGVFAGFYFLSYQEATGSLPMTNAEAQELQRKLNKVRAVANNLSEFEQEVAALERKLSEALKQLPDRKQFEDLLRDISTVGKRVGVTIKSLERESEVHHDFYAEVPFVLELEGSYHDIGRFFDRVAKLPRIVNVGSLRVVVGNEDVGGTTLHVKGTASTFRFLNGQAATGTPLSGDRA
jgi:type IV pilus assembly protein PilO